MGCLNTPTYHFHLAKPSWPRKTLSSMEKVQEYERPIRPNNSSRITQTYRRISDCLTERGDGRLVGHGTLPAKQNNYHHQQRGVGSLITGILHTPPRKGNNGDATIAAISSSRPFRGQVMLLLLFIFDASLFDDATICPFREIEEMSF
ncbi:hypothetical protein CEXT_166501 [Caerostris extrusa]|uniref:Uncharacterized protein n=1 Tax=Caerostris extrusa TaxID=172846 RepID=A0AAV4V6I5_CAEEX|nr:hypothetical protein CEXT_166501 [Caerostris extrusa]